MCYASGLRLAIAAGLTGAAAVGFALAAARHDSFFALCVL
jgi:hypothetical protein